MSAADSLSRIVSLVAELTRREQDAKPAPTLDELAQSFAVSPAQIQSDLRTLTVLGEAAESEWLLSLRVWQQDDRVSVSSQGPFRRPLRLTPEEMLAVQISLVSDRQVELARRLGSLRQTRVGVADTVSDSSRWLQQVDDAVTRQLRVRLLYAGEGERTASWWSVQPHQLVAYRDRSYVVAWCEDTGDWRHFRMDRVADFAAGPERFEARSDFVPVRQPQELFRGADTAEMVVVRFGPAVARWIRERYPEAAQTDGSVVVQFRVANPDWLVRRVLEYGPDAEVVSPAGWRETMRAAVA